VVDTAELGNDDRLDLGLHGRRYLRVGDLAGTNAFAVVLYENAGGLAPGNVPWLSPGPQANTRPAGKP
jgi:hypothetical protein